MNEERATFIRRVFETALFFRDMYEEGNDGNTKAIELLKPIKSVKNTTVRQFVLHELYKQRRLTLTEAAVQLAAWQPDGNAPLFIKDTSIAAELRALCFPHERKMRDLSDMANKIVENEVIQRSFFRAARYIQRIVNENAPAHSRVVELFIPEVFVPRGYGKNGSGHREHVVPCVFLRDECIARFSNGATIDQVANFLQRNVVIVEITKEEQKRLDGSITNGGMGLKNSMPNEWQFDTGCIFQRLHAAKIAFDPPQEFGTCSH